MPQLPYIDINAQLPNSAIDLLASKEDKAAKGVANGYAPLDASSKVPLANLPDQASLDAEVAAAVSAHNALTTSVHGIANTANLVLTNDARLTDARTPAAHKTSHTMGSKARFYGSVPTQGVAGIVYSTPVHIAFDNEGPAPTSPLFFNGEETINDRILRWNDENPNNTITLIEGDGTIVPFETQTSMTPIPPFGIGFDMFFSGGSIAGSDPISGPISSYASISIKSPESAPGDAGTFFNNGLTAERIYTLPDRSGELVVVGDLQTALGGKAAIVHANSHSTAKKAEVTIVGTWEGTQSTIRANNAGSAGNSITLAWTRPFFVDYFSVNDALANWNNANPSNQATLVAGDGRETLFANHVLSGGTDAGSDPLQLLPAHAASHLPARSAQFSGKVSGMQSEVIIRANNAGATGNTIEIEAQLAQQSGNTFKTINQLIADWNSANPSNQATLIMGDGTQVLDGNSLQSFIRLSGGHGGGSDPLPEHAHTSEQIFDSTTAGRTLLRAADAQAQREAIDIFVVVANFASLPATGQIERAYITGDTRKVYAWSSGAYIELSPSEVTSVNTKTGAVTLTASDVGAQPAGSYAPASGINPTAITGTAVVTNDARLTDARTPTAHTHPASQITSLPVELVIACSDETSNLTVGTNKVTFRSPYAVSLTNIYASVTVAPSGSAIVVNVKKNGATLFANKPYISSTTKFSTTDYDFHVLGQTANYSGNILDFFDEITIDIDQIGSTIAGKGLKVILLGTRV